MSSPFVAEIRVVAFNFAPTGWALCNGQLMPISQNTALFSLLGTYYGGDGKSTFALPDFQGATALSQGQSSTGSEFFLGQMSGTPSVTLLQSEMPFHTHAVSAAIDPAELQAPAATRALARSGPGIVYQTNTSSNLAQLSPYAASIAGGSLPHNNMPPVVAMNFIIALQGVFPPRG
jgi:microcystin-dependent protein